jgi:hypothetical protein
MNSGKKNIFSSSAHFTRDELVHYSAHRLNESEQHEMEKHLVDCELCSEALKGISEMKNASGLYEVSKELHLRARRKHLLKKKIFSQNELITIFAVVFLILFLILISIFFFTKQSRNKISLQENKKELKQ